MTSYIQRTNMADDGRRMPSAARVARFWANRCLKNDAPLIYASICRGFSWTHTCCDVDESRFTHTYCDPGEPDCLSCERYLGQTVQNDSSPSFNGIRAHIVPRWLGGKDTVWNILPLCSSCHELNPEQESRQVYLNWLIYRRRYVVEVRQQFINQAAIEYPVISSQLDMNPARAQAIASVLLARIDEVIYASGPPSCRLQQTHQEAP